MSDSEKVLKVFQDWDVDSDGFISRTELANVLASLDFPEADIGPVFDAADVDRDGVLNYSEFVSWIFSDEAPHEVRLLAAEPCLAAAPSSLGDECAASVGVDGGASGGSGGSGGSGDGPASGVPVDGAALAEAGIDLSPWPLGKLRAALRASAGPTPARGYAVVLTTGAMNPVHRGHAQQLHQARERLEAAGYRVLTAWLSPSHDGYVQPKCSRLRTVGLSAPFRLELARRALELDDFVSVGAWEATKEGTWPDFPVVANALQDELRRHRDCRGLQVFYVCGTDHFRKCGLHTGMRSGVGVVAVPRGGDGPMGREKPEKLVYVAKAAEGEVAGYSSTQVRAALEANDLDYVRRAISPSAAQLLLQPSPAEAASFRKDYKKLGVEAPSV